jgi:hypothetical protein
MVTFKWPIVPKDHLLAAATGYWQVVSLGGVGCKVHLTGQMSRKTPSWRQSLSTGRGRISEDSAHKEKSGGVVLALGWFNAAAALSRHFAHCVAQAAMLRYKQGTTGV